MRTHPYAPIHALTHHPLATWLKLYQTDPAAATAQTVAQCERFGIQPQSSDFETQVLAHATDAAQRGDLRSEHGPRYIKETTKFLELFDYWIRCGQKVFEFGAGLTGELTQTEAPAINGFDLNTPMPSFYITFDMDPPYVMPDDLLFDGILVSMTELDHDKSKKIDLIFMGRPGKHHYAKPPIAISIPLLDSQSDIRTLMDEEFRVSDQYRKNEEREHGELRDIDLDEARRDIGERAEHRRMIFTDLYQLIVGSLLFLSTYHEKGKEGWSPNAPAKFVSKMSGQKEEAAKAAKWLADKGWSRSTYFNIGQPTSGPVGSGSVNHVATHWRSGHWRRTAVGPKGSDRKLSWIRPILVNADKGSIENKTLIIRVNGRLT